VRAQVAAAPVWSGSGYLLPLRESSVPGTVVRASLEQLQELETGDWVQIRGSLNGKVLSAESFRKLTHEAPPSPVSIALSELSWLNGGQWLRAHGNVTAISERAEGRTIEIADHDSTAAVFLPQLSGGTPPPPVAVRLGDRVVVTGVADGASSGGVVRLLIRSAEDLEIVETGSRLPTMLLVSALAAIALLLVVWWARERRMGEQRQSLRAFHALSEEIIAASSPVEIAEKLVSVLPAITQATSVRLYLFNQRTKSLERVPTMAEPEPMAVPIDAAAEGLAGGAIVCLRNRTLLNIPEARRSPFLQAGETTRLPRSAMFVPLFTQNDVLGVLEVANARRPGYFTQEEQAAAQHLANQVAASLKLQEQQNMREQIFRSEKLAATGQLISGVASELQAPLHNILQLAASLAAYQGRPAPERELRELSGESQRAAEIVARLVSFARPEDGEARPVDLNATLAGLMLFREPEWKTLELRVQNRLAHENALVLGAQGQIEQVFLNLLVHAEQCAAETPLKSMSVASTRIAQRAIVEISYASGPEEETDELPIENNALGLAVCQGILRSHGGELRYLATGGVARFEVELPLVREEAAAASKNGTESRGRAMTVLLVDSDTGGQRRLMGMLGTRGHRVVPVSPEEAGDLAQRLRFDAIFWAMRPGGPRWSEMLDRIRVLTPGFVLIAEAYEAGLALSIEESGGFLLGRPIADTELDRVLREIESRLPSAVGANPARM
jgi:signal transduction histidine kinase